MVIFRTLRQVTFFRTYFWIILLCMWTISHLGHMFSLSFIILYCFVPLQFKIFSNVLLNSDFLFLSPSVSFIPLDMASWHTDGLYSTRFHSRLLYTPSPAIPHTKVLLPSQKVITATILNSLVASDPAYSKESSSYSLLKKVKLPTWEWCLRRTSLALLSLRIREFSLDLCKRNSFSWKVFDILILLLPQYLYSFLSDIYVLGWEHDQLSFYWRRK